MNQPLQGKRVVITRTAAQTASFRDRLAAAGAIPVVFPAIAVELLAPEPLLAALERLSEYDWLLFTSGNAVSFFFEVADGVSSLPPLPRVAATGSATARKLADRGVTVDFIPDEFVGEALVLGLGDVADKRVLLPRSKRGRPEITALLRERGALVDDIPLYDTVAAQPDQAAWDALATGFDVVTFTSPSSVRNFLDMTDDRVSLAGAIIACIGPITAAEAAERGLEVAVIPEVYTIDGLIAALTAHYETLEARSFG